MNWGIEMQASETETGESSLSGRALTAPFAVGLVVLIALTFLALVGSALPDRAAAADDVVLSLAVAGDGNARINANPWPNGTGSCDSICLARFNRGAEVTLTVDPAPRSRFINWGGGAEFCGQSPTCVLTLDQDTVVKAWFYHDDDGLVTIMTKTGNGFGTVKSNPDGIDCGTVCIANFNGDETVTLTAVAEPGSVFKRWEGACSGSSPTCSLRSIGGEDDIALARAVFESEKGSQANLLFINKKGDGEGAVFSDPNGIQCGFDCVVEFGEGAEVTLTATPETGSVFTGWGGACGVTTGPVCRVTMNGARWAQAGFAPVRSPAAKPRFGVLKVTPKVRVTKPGKRVVFKAKVKNNGGSTARAVKICVKAPKKFVKVKKCKKVGSIAPGKSGGATFKVSVRKKAKQIKLTFKVTGKAVSGKKAKARLKVK